MKEHLEKPLVIYDGECRFCRFWVDRWKAEAGEKAAYAPYQKLAEKYPELGAEKFKSAVHLIMPDGTIASGARATFLFMASSGVRRWPLWLYERVPGLGAVAEKTYKLIRHHRAFFLRLSKLALGDAPPRPPMRMVRTLFLRALGVMYAVALLSLFVQIPGLYGDEGILPIVDTIAAARSGLGSGAAWFFPSLAWLFPSAGFLQFLALAGAACGIALAAGVLSAPVAFGAWISTLSIVAVGRDFTSFQWDHLLIEAGFLAIFLARSSSAAPPRALVWLYRWLLFRLLFSSGVVKLASGDRTWRDLTALAHHYETQPLPNPIAWFMHRLPLAAQQASVIVMFAVELAAPLLIFAPRRLRFVAAGAIASLQLLILLTGNYAFFNWLTLALCLFLLDDALLGRLSFLKRAVVPEAPARYSPSKALRIAIWLIAILSGIQVLGLFIRPLPAPLPQISGFFAPTRIVNGYGLFAVMTVSRPEIVIEGSNDSVDWRPYEFKYKPGDVKRPPPWVAPHQPRLDWQMWFAALRSVERTPWFANLTIRLLQGSKPVERLFIDAPFKDAPPKRLRAVLYDYRFTTPEERARDGAWWRREMKTYYLPEVTLR